MNDFFDGTSLLKSEGTRARAAHLNAVTNAVEDAFDMLPGEDEINMGLINYAVDTGTTDAYEVYLPQGPTALTDGMQVVFKATYSNTGACTIDPNGLGATTITRQDGSTPIPGDIGADKITELRYNSTSGNFEIQGSIGAAAGTGTMAAQNANTVSITGGTIANTNISGGTTNPTTLQQGGVQALTTSGSQTVTNKEIDADSNTLSNLEHGSEVDSPSSGVHGVSGNVVGTWGAQELQDKTLTDPKINEDVVLTAKSTDLNQWLSKTGVNLDDAQTVSGLKNHSSGIKSAGNYTVEGLSTGRCVLRSSQITFQVGTTPGTHVDVALSASIFQGDTDASSDLSKSATVGNWTMNAGGTLITLDSGGLSGNCLAVLSYCIYKAYIGATHYTMRVRASSNDMLFELYTWNVSPLNALDWTSIIGGVSEIMYGQVTYITDA